MAWTTRVSNPVCYPCFRTSASVIDQRVAFATGVPPNIYAFHRYTWNSTLLFSSPPAGHPLLCSSPIVLPSLLVFFHIPSLFLSPFHFPSSPFFRSFPFFHYPLTVPLLNSTPSQNPPLSPIHRS